MSTRMLSIAVALALPTVLAAQAPTPPNERAADQAKAKVAEAMARRATRVRGHAVGPDNRPVTPATPATPATRATPGIDGGPATPATPASPSRRPPNAGTGQGRRP